jgi:hypothetical protein
MQPAMESPSPKRRLPVIGNKPEPEEVPAAPGWWPLLGGVIVVATWVPQALVVMFLIRKWGGSVAAYSSSGKMLLGSLLLLSTFALSSLLGGALVGNFYDRARSVDSTMAGLWGWTFIMLLAALGNGFRPVLVGVIVGVCLLAIALPVATLGGRWGRSRRVNN